MKKRSRITNAQLFEAFNNPASVNGLTAGQIQNHLKSKNNRMTNITGKDVKIAIHRGVQSNAIQQKPRGRFCLCDYFCSAGSNGKSKSGSKSPSRKNSSIIHVRSHVVRSHNRKKNKKGQLKKKGSTSFIKKSSKSELSRNYESESDTEHPLSAVNSKHMVVDSESKRLAKRKRKLPRSRCGREDVPNQKCANEQISDGTVFCDSEESDDSEVVIDGEDNRRSIKRRKGGSKVRMKLSKKSLSRLKSRTHLEAGEGRPLKSKYREDSDGSECSDPPTSRKSSRKENQVRILEYSEPCKHKKYLKFEGKPVNIVEDSDSDDSEASVSWTSLHQKKKGSKSKIRRRRKSHSGNNIIMGKDIKYCKLCPKRVKKTKNELNAIGYEKDIHPKFVEDSEESSDEESD